MLQEIRISEEARSEFSENFRQKYPEYECYIAVGSDIDLVADTDIDKVPSDWYNDGRGQITVVTFLHKRVLCPKAINMNWHKLQEKKALEHHVTWHMHAFCGSMRWCMRESVWVLSKQIELQAKLLKYFLGSNKSNINQSSIKQQWGSWTFKSEWILTSRIKFKCQKGGGETWGGTWMRQHRRTFHLKEVSSWESR